MKKRQFLDDCLEALVIIIRPSLNIKRLKLRLKLSLKPDTKLVERALLRIADKI